MAISTRNPAEMSGEERIQEIAAILARCIQKLENKQEEGGRTTLERSLTGLPSASKHSCVRTKKRQGGHKI